ncbi:MAG: lipoyl(octanoyl) transferase LipB [Phycisphaerales bacterium]|nr:lipoyl(octanoyl) transferase LipB [Phycisphaerales bacterium]
MPTIDLGRTSYAAAYERQLAHHAEVLAARDSGRPEIGRILLVEHHPPVITISRRAGASAHLLAPPEELARRGVTLAETDRGGDITYHGPGQLVVYPILDLNLVRLGLHDYMRLLEQAVIDCCERIGIATHRDPAATGVWVNGDPPAKIAAMGVRVRKWVTMHGLALNVSPDLSHFALIVPCGLVGRTVTSIEREIGPTHPAMPEVKRELVAALTAQITAARRAADSRRG